MSSLLLLFLILFPSLHTFQCRLLISGSTKEQRTVSHYDQAKVAQTMNKQPMEDGEKQIEKVSSSAKASSNNIPRDLRNSEEDLAFSVDYFGASTHPPSHN